MKKPTVRENNNALRPGLDSQEEYLLTEYKVIGEFWRHAEVKIETTINYYLSTLAAFAPATILLYNYVSDLKLFVAITLFMDTFLIGMGYLLVQRTSKTEFHRAEYLLAFQLIRRYFVDKYPTIQPYIYFPVSDPIQERETAIAQVKPHWGKRLVFGINVANSILFGWIVSGSIWLALNTQFTHNQLIIIGITIAVCCFLILHIRYSKKIKNVKSLSNYNQ